MHVGDEGCEVLRKEENGVGSFVAIVTLDDAKKALQYTRNSEDIHYMLGALKTLGLQLEVDSANNRAVVEGCGGQFPVGKESTEEVQLF
ncbi:hypothetical protein IFM89_032606 [Coptis chinensis]|uniref:Uncharacterized protein n=1 Tax=Coptis chinensis TaxID=261450 RepID=A0A835IPD7_9MAGN|nr:hypothetical protein IFM89_032606 [Coptis chinensis]